MKEYQLILSEQLRSAAASSSTATMLGVAVGEDRYLVHMSEVNEVVQLSMLARVSLTQPWFLGIANVRGNLYGIIDLGVYLGGVPMPFGLKARVLLASSRYRVNSGLLVSSMLGIRILSDFELVENTNAPDRPDRPGIAGHYKDKERRSWRELNLRDLILDEKFLQIAI